MPGKLPVARVLALILLLAAGFSGRLARAEQFTYTPIATLTNAYPTIGRPVSSLAIDSQGNLYGTAIPIGDGNMFSGPGTAYEVAAGSRAVSAIATFSYTNGYYPYGNPSVDSQGNVYGTTYGGGTAGGGTAYEIAAGSNSVTTLYNFGAAANGSTPLNGLVLDSQGNAYGTTNSGGANNGGTIFRIDASTGNLTTLYSFASHSNQSSGVTLDAQGNIYGVTGGTAYELSARTGQLTTLATFDGTNGSNAVGNLVLDAQGNIYGRTASGGLYGDGTVFEIAAGTGQLLTLANFSSGTDSYLTGLTIDAQGDLFGVNFAGAFEVAAGTQALSMIYTNPDPTNNPLVGSLAIDAQGNLYGVNGYQIYELSPSVVPEPATVIGLVQGVGLLALGVYARTRRRGRTAVAA